jgi:cell division protein FtsB
MRLDFDFHAALGNGTIARILVENEQVKSHLQKELEALRIRITPAAANTTVG